MSTNAISFLVDQAGALWVNGKLIGPAGGLFYPENYGGRDITALQAAVDAADAAGGGTIVLGLGTYSIPNGSTWKIGKANSQHHINIVGVNPVATIIACDTYGGGTAIELNLEKYVFLANFSVQNQGLKGGYGIKFGGDNGPGTQTNGNNVIQVGFSNFRFGAFMSGGIGTSSEIKFDHCFWQGCDYGFYSANFNGVNYMFEMCEIYDNAIAGIFITLGNVTIIGGASAGNGTDFYLAGGNDSTAIIMGFRSEIKQGGTWLRLDAVNYLSIDGCLVHSVVPQQLVRLAGEGYIKNTQLGGWISWGGFSQSGTHTALTLDHVDVVMPGFGSVVTWSLGNQINSGNEALLGPSPYGPGVIIPYGAPREGAKVYTRNVYEGNSNSYIPDVDGTMITHPHHPDRGCVVAINKGQGETLTLVNNALSIYAYMHHVNDNGVLKNLNLTEGLGLYATELVLIPDQEFTTDTTGNIGKTSLAIIGQPMIFKKDFVNNLWYPSY